MDRESFIPWGKFKGKRIKAIPSGYLRWLARDCDDEEICEAADQEYNEREEAGEHFWE